VLFQWVADKKAGNFAVARQLVQVLLNIRVIKTGKITDKINSTTGFGNASKLF